MKCKWEISDHEMKRNGLEIPGDVALVGFGDIKLCLGGRK